MMELRIIQVTLNRRGLTPNHGKASLMVPPGNPEAQGGPMSGLNDFTGVNICKRPFYISPSMCCFIPG